MRLYFIFLFTICHLAIFAQGIHQYEIRLKDKLNSPYSLENPELFLSERALERRSKQNIDLDESDLPISPSYFEGIKALNVNIVSWSKWFNDIVIEINDTSILEKIRDLSYVESVYRLPGDPSKRNIQITEKLKIDELQYYRDTLDKVYGEAYHQAHMIGADYLHDLGYKGESMRIAVIDAGFSNLDNSVHFDRMIADNRLIDYYDFVDRDRKLFQHSNHGFAVMTTLGSEIQGTMVGTAPKAEYLVFRTEDGAGEYLLEEYFWVEAAEFADSAGCDVFNTSLGYTRFQDSLQNHTWEDLDGKTTRISRGSDMAASKGILVFNSAGNSGNKDWIKIGAPADGHEVIAVGAVDEDESLAAFSSRGYSADRRIKPDLLAMGLGNIVGGAEGNVYRSAGTSFASPILAGMGACLWQAHPNRTASEVREALKRSADNYSSPDSNRGYGIPNAIIAHALLDGKNVAADQNFISLGPNPFSESIFITYFASSNKTLYIQFYDLTGRLTNKTEYQLESGRTSYIHLEDTDIPRSSGMYIMKVDDGSGVREYRLVRE